MKWYAEIINQDGSTTTLVFDKKKELIESVSGLIQGGAILNRIIRGKEVEYRVRSAVEVL